MSERNIVLVMALVIGVLIGGISVLWFSGQTVSAQAGWQCRSWNPEQGSTAEIGALQTFLGNSRQGSVVVTSAGGFGGTKYTLVACKL